MDTGIRQELGNMFRHAVAQLFREEIRPEDVVGVIQRYTIRGLEPVGGTFRVDQRSGTGLYRLPVCFIPVSNLDSRLIIREFRVTIPADIAKGHPFRADTVGHTYHFVPRYVVDGATMIAPTATSTTRKIPTKKITQ